MRNPLALSWLYRVLELIAGVWFLCSVASSQCHEHQRSLLLQVRQELFIDPSNTDSKLASWTPKRNCCLWDGVTCDRQTGDIVSLDLSSSSITGGINGSSTIFNLHHLQYLNLANNSLYSSPYPSGFSRLSSLTHLNLSWIGFFGQVPHEISLLSNLISLDLSTFPFTLTEPVKFQGLDLENFLKNLTRLRVLRLDGVDISMSGTRWCHILSSTLPNLRILSLSKCNLTGALHPSLLQLQFLTNLELNGNKLASTVPQFLSNFSSLETLELSLCGLYGRFPNSIFLMPTLRTLDVSYNYNLTGTLPEFPPGSALQVISLSSTKFSGNLPNSINNLEFLLDLQLSECGFFGSIPPTIENLTELRYLDLARNNFSGTIPSLALSKKITGLHFSDNQFTGTIPSSYGNELNNLEILNLRNNSLKGMIPVALFIKPSLKWLVLGQNQLSGRLKEFQNASSSRLREIDLGQNALQGPIPMSIFKLSGLNVLRLSSNQFNGTISIHDMIKGISKLTVLDLSGNNLSVDVSSGNSTTFSHITTLGLGSCNIKAFPGFMRDIIYLSFLDLSNNKIRGEIPNWIWKLGSGHLVQLNLSHNMLSGFETPGPNFSSSELAVLDLHSNLLQGPFIMPPPSILLLDYSDNKFSSTLPYATFNDLYYAIFISLSSNFFAGEIPGSICETVYLQVLDLSNNQFNGSIPPCLSSNHSLKVLNLRYNKLHGMLPQTFGENCSLRTLDVNQNHLAGPLSRSLANCRNLEVLDVSNNNLNGSFPFWLENLPLLRVLVLRSNDFGGSIICSKSENAFPMLQIIDLSSNNFRGKVPSEWFKSWKGMMKQANSSHSSQFLRFVYLELNPLYYQDSVTLVNKGLIMELKKILTIFTSINLSNNQFEGEIPDTIGDLGALYVLNMSNNHFTGQIPLSFGKLKELGSLDLSENRISGKIPQQLTELTFLSALNLLQNLLVGEIPGGNQFQTFSAASFEGNIGLCGFPLSKTCSSALPPMETNANHAGSSKQTWGIDWDFYWIGFGCGGGIGLNIGVIVGNIIINKILKRRRGRRVHRIIRQLHTKPRNRVFQNLLYTYILGNPKIFQNSNCYDKNDV